MTVRNYAAIWAREQEGRKRSTRRHYKAVVRAIERLNPYWLDNDMATVHVVQARNFTFKHRYTLPVLRAMFNQARRDGYVMHNPFAKLGFKGSTGRREIMPLVMSEVASLAEVARMKGYGLGDMVKIAAWVGLRPGEIWALEGQHFDPERKALDIKRRVYKGRIDLPKNGKTRRVAVPDFLIPALTGEPGKLLFPGPSGGYWHPSTFYDYWHPIRRYWQRRMIGVLRQTELAEARGKDNLDFYELRHFCATWLLDHGLTPEDVAIHLGHSDGGRMVRELYGHPDHDKARERLREALNGDSAGATRGSNRAARQGARGSTTPEAAPGSRHLGKGAGGIGAASRRSS